MVCTWADSRQARTLSLGVAALSVAAWLLVRHQIARWLGFPPSGWMIDVWRNVTLLLPHHLSQDLSAGGFLAIPVFLCRRLITDRRLRLVWWSLLPLLLSDLLFGLWNETRIFGEFSLIFAVTAAIEFEAWITGVRQSVATSAEEN